MNGTLKVTPTQLQQTASSFQSTGNTVRTTTEQMMAIVKSLASVWEGDAATTFINKFNELQDDIERINAMINDHVTDLEEMANNYIQAETTNTDAPSGLNGNVIV